jgi:phosphoserine phosphatase
MPAFRTVIFDCDSTLSAIEGIEELAGGHKAEIARLTDLAMQGAIPLEDVYGRRLDLIRPSRAEVDRVAALYVARLVPGAQAVVRGLIAEGIEVYILSGGLAPAVQVIGRHLGIPESNIVAVEVRFDGHGRYAGFDVESPLARSGGKRRWIESRADLLRPILLVGDGATDLEARPAVDRFAAFVGVVRREPVVTGADYLLEGPTLDPVLDLAVHGVLIRPAGG